MTVPSVFLLTIQSPFMTPCERSLSSKISSNVTDIIVLFTLALIVFLD
jgi:hypothetical protein